MAVGQSNGGGNLGFEAELREQSQLWAQQLEQSQAAAAAAARAEERAQQVTAWRRWSSRLAHPAKRALRV